MAHQQQKDFCLSVKEKLPEYFEGKWVLDIGSLDINGNNQYLFEQSGYIGIDLLPGRNVDFASKGHELQLPNDSFDVIVSTECFEHDPHYEKTIKNIVRMLKPGGLFVFSCATTGRPEHGTRRTTPEDAPLTHEFGEWGDYYKNLEETDIRKVIDIDQNFSKYEFSEQHETHDLYFWGVKQGVLNARDNYSFRMEDSPNCKLDNRIKILELAESSRITLEAETRQRLEAVHAELAQADSKLEYLEQELRQAQEKYSFVQSKLLQAENRYKSLEVDLKHQINFVDQIVGSISWRITRPLRFFERLIRG